MAFDLSIIQRRFNKGREKAQLSGRACCMLLFLTVNLNPVCKHARVAITVSSAIGEAKEYKKPNEVLIMTFSSKVIEL
jgi:hypothetical protein